MIEFDFPILLYMAPAAGFVMTSLAYWARQARVKRARQWSEELANTAQQSGRRGPLLLGVATLAATVSLAGPRFGSRVVETESKGLSLVIAVDVSRSMLAEDGDPSRLVSAKREARRLIHDLEGDRMGLIAFAGQSFIMSPLTVDGSALHLLVDALDPDIASAGGSNLSSAIGQGRELLLAKEEVADRVLVVFSDGEAHDSLAAIVTEAERLRRDRIHLILVAEGGRDPVPIPERDLEGNLEGYQRDQADNIVETMRRDDILATVADAAQGMLVAADVADQAGTVRDLVSVLKRSPEATTTAAQDISRAWIPLLIAALLLMMHSVTRRSPALASLAVCLGLSGNLEAQSPRNAADVAWTSGDLAAAQRLYYEQAQAGLGGDTTWFNLGTAAMARWDTAAALAALKIAAGSIDPQVRFRARYNLGLLELRLAERDDERRTEHLEAARSHYREALLLKPGDDDSKWNLELAVELLPPEGAGGAKQPDPAEGGEEPRPPAPQGLSAAQAEQILNSIAEEERRTREQLNRRRHSLQEARGRKNW
jgi:Ca-activated chloride channel family protein